ncbi:sedoheptulokinase [Paenibacillus pedocola]|uniref:sedoheptulokinase n=1 Tax=Paenibacillus pedocola TaxID=3242193 RepID=UPI0028773D99|nr:FGGY family carbohydrate kinase [Paenibacillus typhae]
MKFIGLDIGTTSITGLIYDLEQKTVVCSVTEDTGNGTPEHREEWERLQDPESIIQRTCQILEQLYPMAEEISGIGLTGQMHGIVYTDNRGQHVSPLYTWQDGRAGLPCADGSSYAHKLSEITGYTVAPGYGLATHYYNIQNGLVPAAAVSFCTIADYAALRLTGSSSPLIDPTQAAGIGCYSFETGGFDYAAIERAGIHTGLLPQVVPSGTVVGTTQAGIPVYCSLGDNQASFIGSVPVPDESVLLNIGTGSQLSVLLPDAEYQLAGMEIRPFPGGGRLVVGAALSGGKSYVLLEHFFRELITAYTGEAPGKLYSFMEQLLSDGETAGTELTVNTQFLGTRTDPEVRGSIGQISLDNFTPARLAHGFLQGMIDELYAFYTTLTSLTGNVYKYAIGSGNALRANAVLCAKAQSTFKLPLALSHSPEEAAVGAALYAAVGAGGIESFTEAGQYIGLELPADPEPIVPEADRQRLMKLYGLTLYKDDDVLSSSEQLSTLGVKYNPNGLQESTIHSSPYRIKVTAGASIGPLRLGMSRSEIETAGADLPVFYKVGYDTAGLANFIEIANPEEEAFCTFGETDLFRTPASELIEILDQISPYQRDHAETGCTYIFPHIGFTLWRSMALTEADLLTDEYRSLPPDIYEDEKRRLYFESVSVFPVEVKS